MRTHEMHSVLSNNVGKLSLSIGAEGKNVRAELGPFTKKALLKLEEIPFLEKHVQPILKTVEQHFPDAVMIATISGADANALQAALQGLKARIHHIIPAVQHLAGPENPLMVSLGLPVNVSSLHELTRILSTLDAVFNRVPLLLPKLQKGSGFAGFSKGSDWIELLPAAKEVLSFIITLINGIFDCLKKFSEYKLVRDKVKEIGKLGEEQAKALPEPEDVKSLYVEKLAKDLIAQYSDPDDTSPEASNLLQSQLPVVVRLFDEGMKAKLAISAEKAYLEQAQPELKPDAALSDSVKSVPALPAPDK